MKVQALNSRFEISTSLGLSKLVFDFLFCKFLVYSDGSGRTMDSKWAKGDKIYEVWRIGYMGAIMQPSFARLGYDLQSEFIDRFANAEHAALHLWISYARDDSFLRDHNSTRASRKRLFEDLQFVSGLDEHSLEEGFVTNIQLLANGIQPDVVRMGELETATAFLGLQAHAITAALAFVAFFRAQVSKHFDKREMLKTS